MKHSRFVFWKEITLALLTFHATAQADVLTYHNDNTRQGANLNETTLTPANVNQNSFGQLFNYNLDGNVFAQPLYVSGVNIPGQGAHNVVFVATEHNSVYALDADSNSGANGGVLWQVNLGPSATSHVNTFPFQVITPEVGITGTPVIDLGSQTLYVDAFTHEGTNYIHRVHALNIADGSERIFSPVVVSASVPGVGAGSTNGIQPFQAIQQLQRSALTLAGGILYVCYCGYTDTAQEDPYHGWIIGFNAANLQVLPNYVFNTTPNGTTGQFGSIAGRGGIWMGGGGMAVDDANNLYLTTGDGNFTAFAGSNGRDYGDTYLKLSTAGGLSVADYFTPYTQSYQQVHDQDSGSGGVILLPDQPGPFPHLMVGAGKLQRAFVINRDMMTSDNQHINTNSQSDNVVQSMPLGGGSYDTPAYFNGNIYYIAMKDVIRSYALSNGTLVPDLPNSAGTRAFSFPGATPSVSANGDANGIVWAVQNGNPAVLVAYDATDMSTEIYNSTQAGARDQLPAGVKFAVPTVANGKVFVGTQGALSVFGLFNNGAPWAPVAASYSGLFFEPDGVEFGRSGPVSIQVTKQGKFTGKLGLSGKNYPFKGILDSTGAGMTVVSAKNVGALTLNLQVNTSDNNTITGTVNGDSWNAELTAYRATLNKRTNPASFAGKYSLDLPGPGDGNPDNPQNDGTGTLTVDAAGQLKIKGVLGDGTKFTQSATVSQDGNWPFYVPLYKNGGQIMGWFNFDGSGDVGGQASWIKLPNLRNKAFPDGFDLNPVATGSEQ
jgi:hypothetical protein